MKLVTLELRDDGNVYDKNGAIAFYWGKEGDNAWRSFDSDLSQPMDVKSVIQLKEAGFDSKEVIEMFKAGVVK